MNHERLDCYRKLVELAPKLQKITSCLPTGHYYLADQLKRALASSILNLAEGNAKFGPKERRRFFLTSRASLAEVSAIIDILQVFNLISSMLAIEYKKEVIQIYAMISNLKS